MKLDFIYADGTKIRVITCDDDAHERVIVGRSEAKLAEACLIRNADGAVISEYQKHHGKWIKVWVWAGSNKPGQGYRVNTDTAGRQTHLPEPRQYA
jgi:hypothetical protein